MTTGEKQLGALGFCAFVIPAVLILPSAGWAAATFASTVSALLTWRLLRLRGEKDFTCSHGKLKKCLLFALLLWMLFALGAGARQLCSVFPDSRQTPLIGLLLLLLAAYSSGKGRSLTVGAVCIFFLMGLFLLFFALSIPNLSAKNLAPQEIKSWQPLTAALLPVNFIYINDGKHKKIWPWLLGGILFALLAALVTQGCLSSQVAAQIHFPFYEAAKSVTLFGAIQRLEPLVSAGLTLAGFCLLSLLCSVSKKLFTAVFPPRKKLSPCINFLAGITGFYLSGLTSGTFIALGTTIFWGILPFFILVIEKQKNIKNF